MALATSKVAISNMALTHLGFLDRIEALSENTAHAKPMNLWFDIARQQVLEAHNWNFARKRITLVTHADDPPSGVWDFRYVYPVDSLKIRFIQPAAGKSVDHPPFTVELDDDGVSKSILTDEEDAIAVYTLDVTDPNRWSPLFVNALAAYLAWQTALALTGDKQLRAEMAQQFSTLLSTASGSNSQEGLDVTPREAAWIEART